MLLSNRIMRVKRQVVEDVELADEAENEVVGYSIVLRQGAHSWRGDNYSMIKQTCHFTIFWLSGVIVYNSESTCHVQW